MSSSSFDFDFVISYASEDKAYADSLHKILTAGGVRVFYAPEYRADTWGKNLYSYLAEMYSKKGRFCIPLISSHYVKKQWTLHEWKNAQARALSSADIEYILPIRLDDSELPGLLSTTAYESITTSSIEAIGEVALEKLRRQKENDPVKVEPVIYARNWTTLIFDDRLAQALPGKKGLHMVVDRTKIDRILRTVLQEPLSFPVIMEDGEESVIDDAIWWWRHHRAYPVFSFKTLRDGVCLLNQYELAIAELQMYRDDTWPDLSFVYLKCDPLPPVSVDADDIARHLSSIGYASEYLGYLLDRNIYVSGAEFEDGYAQIDDEVVDIRETSENRLRILSEYSLFLAPKENRINSTDGGNLLATLQDGLLKSEAAMESFISLLRQLPPSPYQESLSPD